MNWDEYFINITEEVAKKSKDPSTKIGCLIVNKDKRIISSGYNGFISGCDENKMSFERPMKYYLTIHSEMNALLFAKQDLSDCSLYSLYAPCENCLKHILQSGIKKIVYKNLFLNSKISANPKSMMDDLAKEAVTRILQSVSGVICKNINGIDYLEELWGKEVIPDF